MRVGGPRRLVAASIVCWQGGFPAARLPRRQLHDLHAAQAAHLTAA